MPATGIDADVGYPSIAVFEKQQVPGLNVCQGDGYGMSALCRRCTGYRHAGPVIDVIHQATAIEAARAGTTIVIRNAQQTVCQGNDRGLDRCRLYIAAG